MARVQRKAASKKTTKKAKRAKPSQKKAAKKKATKKPGAKKVAKKASSKPVRKTTTVAAKKTTAKPISKPPKLDMNSDVMEFIAAIDAYRQEYHRPFPGWSEILFVVKKLGYKKSTS